MTDYLEGLLPGQGGALEEELERLEGLLAPLPPAAAPDTARAEGPEAPAAERDAAGARSDLPPAQRGENRPSGAPGPARPLEGNCRRRTGRPCGPTSSGWRPSGPEWPGGCPTGGSAGGAGRISPCPEAGPGPAQDSCPPPPARPGS